MKLDAVMSPASTPARPELKPVPHSASKPVRMIDGASATKRAS